ncbi:MAG: ParB N-terminal domain-containing protein [Candidatus Nitrosopumilus sp. bin_68KS]
MNIKKIPLEKIIEEERIREDLNIDKIFLSSLTISGLLNPITVMELDNDNYLLLAGKRRLEGCRKLGWDTIDANIIPSETEEQIEH